MDLTVIVKLLGGWRATIFAGLCVALGATAAVQSWRLTIAQADNTKFAAAVSTYEGAQKTNLATIDDLRETNQAWARKCAFDPTAAAEAASATEQAAGALPVDDERRKSERAPTYAVDPSADAWGRARVPAGLLGRLRK
jgi:hypothetical protein